MTRAGRDRRPVLPGWVRRLSQCIHRASPAPAEEPGILAFIPDGPDRLALETLSCEAGWPLTLTPGAAAGWPGGTGTPGIILYDRSLSPEHWREIVRDLSQKSPRPYIVLLSPNSDNNLWDELQRAGGSDIVRTPVTRDHLIEALAKGRQLWFARRHLLPTR